MNAVRRLLNRVLRGPRTSAVLVGFGIDPRRYWLLVDLFGELSDRGEMLDQLGSNRVSLTVVTRLYFAISVLLAAIFAGIGTPVRQYQAFFLLYSGFIILSVLLSETGNSLVNPVEGLILAHQPVSGATYTAAKLTHLLLILLYLVPGLNIGPALAGLTLKDSRWWFPFEDFAAAAGIGIAVALTCCAVFGWLLRFVPARRLRATAQVIAAIPLMAMAWFPRLQKAAGDINFNRWIPNSPGIRLGIEVALAVLAIAGIIGGLRSLSADFLINVSAVVHGGKPAGAGRRRHLTGSFAARLSGAQSARAGSAFLTWMMLRDWQFRRQLIPMLAPIAVFAFDAGRGFKTDAFGAKFGPMHLAPHAFGFLLMFVCFLLPYGNDYKAIWFFQTVPAGSLRGFARGVWASLWLNVIVLPHMILFAVLAAIWGVAHAALFSAYSIAVASLYLSLEIRLIDAVPFMRQPDAKRGSAMLLIMAAFGIAAAVISALQYFLIFHSPAIVAAVTVVVAAAVWLLTQASLRAFEASMRFHLSVASAESGSFYHEIDV